MLVLLHRPPSYIVCSDKNAIPATRTDTLDMLVRYTDHHATWYAVTNMLLLLMELSTLEMLVLLQKQPSYVVCKDINVAPVTRTSTLEMPVLLHRPPFYIMCNDKNVDPAT